MGPNPPELGLPNCGAPEAGVIPSRLPPRFSSPCGLGTWARGSWKFTSPSGVRKLPAPVGETETPVLPGGIGGKPTTGRPLTVTTEPSGDTRKLPSRVRACVPLPMSTAK